MMLLTVALLAAAQVGAAPAAPNYGLPQNWLCVPGRHSLCIRGLKTTALHPNGFGSTGISPIADDPQIDCFYVYPTISRDQGTNSDLVADDENAAVEVQFARFASVCRPFAPLYRSMTVGLIAAVAAGADFRRPFATAYGDVRSAWREYLAKYNKGRPFVLIGHSQGSWMLQALIAQEIEGKPIVRQMKLAIIPGFNVLVPPGKLVGGTFKSTLVCSRPGQTGCVMTWVSYRENNAPPPGAIFGYSDQGGMTVACTNPARPGAAGWQPLDSYWYANSSQSVAGGPISWSSDGPPPSPFLRTEGLVSARCVNDGPRGYLSVRTNADPNDKRTDRIGGEVSVLGMFVPGWGMHLADMGIAQGDLIRQVGELGARGRSTAK